MTHAAITQLLITFSNDMNSTEAQTVANYKLDLNASIPIAINSITYEALSKTATLNVNSGLPLANGAYTLTILATLHDASGISLPENFVRHFSMDTIAPVIIPRGVIGQPGVTILADNKSYTSHFSGLTVTFNKDVQDPAGDGAPEDVTNPANYLLLQKGPNGIYDTPSCKAAAGGNPAGDDVKIPTGPVTYDNHGGSGPFTATLVINNGVPLPFGQYRLFICGTTSITGLAGTALNGGVDSIMTFSIIQPAADNLPSTGFAPKLITALPNQPSDKAYSSLGDLWLEIPRLGVNMSIVGVPVSGTSWDVSWLGAQAGWLNGSAYPTWKGNSVLTGHVYDAFGNPGPFARLNQMWYGNEVIIHAGGAQYVYEVREVMQVGAQDTAAMLKHQDTSWVTLVTCRGYDETSGTYKYRVLVRAVLVKVK